MKPDALMNILRCRIFFLSLSPPCFALPVVATLVLLKTFLTLAGDPPSFFCSPVFFVCFATLGRYIVSPAGLHEERLCFIYVVTIGIRN